MWPLQFELDVKAYHRVGPYGNVLETFPARKARVFSWALVSGNSFEVKEHNAIVLITNERLQVIAPPETFRRPVSGETLEVVVINGQDWTLTDTEEKHDANPWWTPGLSIYWFDREVADYAPPLPGGGGGDPVDPDPGDGDPVDPEEVPAYAYNPYADPDNPKYEQGAGGPYGGPNFEVGDQYNPYADKNSPFYGQGAGEGDPYGYPAIAPGTDWPAGQSAEARNAYQATLGNVG